jgi:predicted DNA-binding protein
MAMKKLAMKSKLKAKDVSRQNRPKPQSFRFSELTVKQLTALGKVTGKKKTVVIEELIDMAYRDTIKK